jgi:quercetin dioxygenase-like cupin family protein
MSKFLTLYTFFIICLWGCTSNKNQEIEVVTLAKGSKSWNGNPLPKYAEGEPEVTILKITIPPKTTLPLHQHPTINAGVMIKGNLTVISETKDTLHLKAGDTIIELVNKWHYGINEGNEPVEIIVFYAGIKGKPITIKKEKK